MFENILLTQFTHLHYSAFITQLFYFFGRFFKLTAYHMFQVVKIQMKTSLEIQWSSA